MYENDVASDLELMKSAFSDVKDELRSVLKVLDGPKSAKSLVETSAQLRAAAERFDNLARAVIELQGKYCI